MNVNKFLPSILDSTFPRDPDASLAWTWSLGIILGEIVAFLIVSCCIRFLSKRKVGWVDSLLIGALATVASYVFGVAYWVLMGFW